MSGRSTSMASSSNKMSLDGISGQQSPNKSSNECRYGESIGCASDTTVRNGRNKLHRSLRSVLTSQMTFKMFAGFNAHYKEATKSSPQTELLQKMLGMNKEDFDSLDFFEQPNTDLFKSAYKKAVDEAGAAGSVVMEHRITAMMVILLQNRINGSQEKDVDNDVNVSLTGRDSTMEGEEIKVLDQGRLEAEEKGKKGNDLKLDITMVSRKRLIAFVEVGLIKNATKPETDHSNIDNIFWKKVDQALNYLKLLKYGVKSPGGRKEQTEWKATGTILFAVMVFDKENRTVNRMGIFSAEPKDKSWNDFRVSLLWRRETYNGDDLDLSYGAFINAVTFLERESRRPSNGNESCIWEYLGPNCSKVTTSDMKSYVVRSFENRVNSSPRRPFVYTHYDDLKDDTTVILEGQDEGIGELLPFGEVFDKERLFSTMFCSKRGQIKVLAVPFHGGSHECTSLDQAIQIVEFLSKMHEKNFVHGDIRGYNLVFSDKANGGSIPIDFDFGGQQDEQGSVKYPPGYATTLEDGSRIDAKDGEAIKFSDDVAALKYALFTLHEFDVFSNVKDDDMTSWEVLSAMNEAYKAMKKVETMAELLDAMKKFQNLAKTHCKDGVFHVIATDDYKKKLMNNPWTKIEAPATTRMTGKNDQETETPLAVQANERKETPIAPKAEKKETPFDAQATPFGKKSIGIMDDCEEKTNVKRENIQPTRRKKRSHRPRKDSANTDAKKNKTNTRTA